MTAILIAIVGAVLSLGSLTSAVILNHHRNKVQEVRLISAEADSFHRTVAKVLDFDCSAPVSEKEERLCNSPSDRVTLLRESYLQRAAFLEQRLRPFESFVTVSEHRVLAGQLPRPEGRSLRIQTPEAMGADRFTDSLKEGQDF
ncbi:MAG: hypothetical protein ACYDBP_12595 [Leptospirales bacterium]